MPTNKFYDESLEQSRVKSQIVSKYFYAWANVILSVQDRPANKHGNNIAYIDLFSGRGRYEDGTKSTPLLVLEKAISDSRLQQRLITAFNDIDKENSETLKNEIRSLPGIERLKHRPDVANEEIGSKITALIERMSFIPTLFFIDPWGYKGLSLRLINAAVKDWGCDCIFFFNYNRVNPGLRNPLVLEHMNALFGEEEADQLRSILGQLPSDEREIAIVESICEVMNERGSKFILPFTFRNATGGRTSHHLIFVSKKYLGYKIMKEVMSQECSDITKGIASFMYNPATVRQPVLFKYSQVVDDLPTLLTDKYKGQTRTVIEIIDDHNIGTPYMSKNYKDVLKALENDGKVIADPPMRLRRKNSIADHVKITFI